MNNILKKKVKKMNSKLHTSNKPRYVSKAERALLADKEAADQATDEQQLTE